MSKFITEKETENYLVSEMRMLTLPDGGSHPVRGLNLMWTTFDLLQETGAFTQERLIDIAHAVAQHEDAPFDKALETVCGYAHEQMLKL